MRRVRRRWATTVGGVMAVVVGGVLVSGSVAADAAPAVSTQTGTVQGLPNQFPTAVAFTADGSMAYVASVLDVEPGGELSAVDPSTGAVTGTVSDFTAQFPSDLIFNPLGTEGIVADAASAIVAVDVALQQQGNTVTGYSGQNPVGMATTPDGGLALVANSGNDSVSLVDLITTSQLSIVVGYTGQRPWGVSISSDGTSALVANRVSNDVSVLEWDPNARVFSQVALIGGFDEPVAAAFLPDGTAYVLNSGSGDGSGSIAIVDVAGRTIDGAVASYSGQDPSDIAVFGVGDAAYVTNYESNSVSVIDLATDSEVGTVQGFTGVKPINIAIAPSGTFAYVANMGDANTTPVEYGSVSIISITVAPTPPAPATITDLAPNAEQLTGVFQPGSGGTLPDTGYTMNVYLGESSTPVSSVSGSGSPLVVADLTNGTAYTVDIVTHNPAGDVRSARSAPVVVGIAPFFEASSPPTAYIGKSYSYTFTAGGLPVPTVSIDTALPAGLTFEPGEMPGTGTIEGTPIGSAGTVDLVVKATSAVSVMSVTVPFTVATEALGEEATPSPNASSTPSPSAGAQTAGLAITGGGGSPVCALAIGGALLLAGGAVLGIRLRRVR